MTQIRNYIVITVFIFGVYYLAGRIGLLLTIPPGHATSIWPASGIAMGAMFLFGYRYWPAVFLGAIGTSLYHLDVIGLQEIVVMVCIAWGASIQAMFGAYMIRKHIPQPVVLEQLKDIIKLVTIGGVLSCLISATCSTLTLFSAGVLPLSAVIEHWYVWWIGDTLGVIVFTPVMLLLCPKKGGGGDVSTRRKISVSVATMVSFSIVAVLFFIAKKQYEMDRMNFLQTEVAEISQQLQKNVNTSLNVLQSVDSFINASNYVSATEYDIFTKTLFSSDTGISGVSWLPKVEHARRDAFEKEMQAQGYPDFAIKRRYAEHDVRPSEEKPYYFPIAYAQPYEQNKLAHGFDVYGEDPVGANIRMKPLNDARDTGRAQATTRFPIVQAEEAYGFIIYHPVYKAESDESTEEARRQNHIGYVNAIFILPILMENVVKSAEAFGLDVIVTDIYAPKNKRLLLDSRTENLQWGEEQNYDFAEVSHYLQKIDIAGRKWQMNFVHKPAHGISGYDWVLWSVISGGTLFTALVGMFMMMVTARTDIVERLVQEKTEALTQVTQFQDLIMKNIPDLLFVKDHESRILQANPAFMKLYPEEQREDVIGGLAVDGYNEEEVEEFLEQDRKALDEGYAETEETIQFPDGRTRTLITKKVRFEDADQQRFLLGIARDVTRKKAVEKDLLEANAELEEFAYRTSHDLRSPIISSIALLQLAESRIEDNKLDDAKQGLDHALQSLDQLKKLIDDILDLTVVRNKDEPFEKIDIHVLIDNALKKMSNLDGYDHIKIETDYRFDGLLVSKNLRLAMIVENLISNAIKYHDPDKDDPHIRIETYSDEKDFYLIVADNGLGIPEKQQKNLFKMFQRFHPKTSYGSGLGLYLLKKSADNIGAEIEYQDVKGETTFILTIPLRGLHGA